MRLKKIIVALLAVVAFTGSLYAADHQKAESRHEYHRKAEVADRININTADTATLTKLKGIGMRKAELIVKYREQHGRFASVEDLTKVRGISDKFIAANREHLTVGEK